MSASVPPEIAPFSTLPALWRVQDALINALLDSKRSPARACLGPFGGPANDAFDIPHLFAELLRRPLVTLADSSNTQEVGQMLYQNYLFAFEIASLLLLVAIIGAVVMAKKRTN